MSFLLSHYLRFLALSVIAELITFTLYCSTTLSFLILTKATENNVTCATYPNVRITFKIRIDEG